MKRNLSTCFFKKSWAHYSFGQMLIAGVLALSITSSTIGATAVAAVTLQSASGSSLSSSMAEATAAPTAAPDKEIDTTLLGMEWYASTVGEPAEAIPDVEVVLSTGGSQQKLSIGVYAEMEDENGYTWNEIIIGVPMEVTIVCDELTELEDEDNETGHAASVEGAISVYEINTDSGTFQLGEIDPGKYTVTLSCEYDNYIMPEPVTVTVVEKISYEVDEDIEMEEEDAGFEDEGTADTTVVENTVRYVDSSSSGESYTLYIASTSDYGTYNGKNYFYYKDTSYITPYEVVTATTTIGGETYTYYASAVLDTSLTVDVDGVVDTSSITTTSASTSTSTSASTATTMQLTTSYDNANFSGLTPLSLSVGSGASTGKAYSTISTLSTVTTKTLVVSSDDTSYGYMTITDTLTITEDDESDSSSESSSSESDSSSDSSSSDSSSSDSSSSDSSSSDSSSSDSSSSDSSSSDSSSSDSSSSDSGSSDTTDPAPTYTVTYTDGVDDEVIFADETTVGITSGSATPAYSGGTPTRDDYTFVAWSPTVDTTVMADVTYTATWTADGSESSSSTTTDTSSWTQTITLYSSGSAQNSTVSYNGSSVTASSLFSISTTTVDDYVYSGWQTIDGVKYYYDPDTNEPVTGTQVINGTTYIFGVTGAYDSQCTGIDVSYWQGTIDWDKVKAAGVEFVIIRAGYRGYSSGTIVQDANFTTYITGAQAAGLRVGIYFFSQAINAAEGVAEASACINLIKSYGTSYPIYIDTEYSGTSNYSGRADGISNADRTAAVVAFCETIKSAGYTPGIYASYSWFTSKLNFSEVSGYSLWNAQWGSTNSMSSAGMWQYTSDGSVNGISGRVDMNISYIG